MQITWIPARSDQPHSEAQRRQAAIEEALRSSRVAESSLQHSRRVGGLLLKNEDEELQRVAEYAEELLNDEYRCITFILRHLILRNCARDVDMSKSRSSSCDRSVSTSCSVVLQATSPGDTVRAGQAGLHCMLHPTPAGAGRYAARY